MPVDGQKPLPERPSLEHLRRQAKRLAKSENLKLAQAQRRVANDYGYATWAELKTRILGDAADRPLPPLHQAARDGDLAALEIRIAAGDDLNANDDLGHTAYWHACDSDAPAEGRLAVIRALAAAGANPRVGLRSLPIHVAARKGPWPVVEAMIREAGALIWQADDKGSTALDYAERGSGPDKALIVHNLSRPVIDDPHFRAAVQAIQSGDTTSLARLLDAHPNLLTDRAVEPDCYPASDYFGSPKLFWFVADNPTLVPRLPDNIVAVMGEMIRRGVEQDDLDYTLELVMTSGPAQAQGLARPMVESLMDAGAVAKPRAILMTLGHAITEPVRVLLERGQPTTGAIAAGLGLTADLPRLLAAASPAEVQEAFGMAVFNRQIEAAGLCLDAGAQVSGPLPVHVHATALHSAVADGDLALVRFLVDRGARRDVADKLWSSTPWGWAQHQGKAEIAAYLESLETG